MARFTFELRECVDTFGREEVKNWFKDYELSDYLTAEEIAVIDAKGVWSKDQLAERILTHFYLREAGKDSIGAFKLMIKDLMSEIMETYSDTPQGQINKTQILNGKYASSTSANENENTASSTGQNDDSGNEHYVRQTIGNSGVSATSQAMVQQYRDIIRALNTEIVYQLEPLFMGIY